MDVRMLLRGVVTIAHGTAMVMVSLSDHKRMKKCGLNSTWLFQNTVVLVASFHTLGGAHPLIVAGVIATVVMEVALAVDIVACMRSKDK